MSVYLTDLTVNSLTRTFNIIVVNQVPTFGTTPLPNQTIHVGSNLIFSLSINDPEN